MSEGYPVDNLTGVTRAGVIEALKNEKSGRRLNGTPPDPTPGIQEVLDELQVPGLARREPRYLGKGATPRVVSLQGEGSVSNVPPQVLEGLQRQATEEWLSEVLDD